MGLKRVLAIAASLAFVLPLGAHALGPSDVPIAPQVENMIAAPLVDTGLAEGFKSGQIQHGQSIADIPIMHSLTGVLKTDVVRKGLADEDRIVAGQYVFGIPMHAIGGSNVITWCAPRMGPGGKFATVCFPALGGANYWVPLGDSLMSTNLSFNSDTPRAVGVSVDHGPASLGAPMVLTYEFYAWVFDTFNGKRHLAANILVKLSAYGHQTAVGHINIFADPSGGFHMPIQNGLVTLIPVGKTGERLSLPSGPQTTEQIDGFYAGVVPEKADLVALAPTATGAGIMIQSKPIWVNAAGEIRFEPFTGGNGTTGAPPPSQIMDLARYFPDRAMRMGVSGNATFRCTIGPGLTPNDAWRLYDCAIAEETPADFGFGAATLNVANTVRMDPNTARAGVKIGQEITKTIVWSAPGNAASGPLPVAAPNGPQTPK
ncbi:MAG TPA: hypothetical protein VGI79_19165 [Caulobacteraceae bacterium]|jgi:hypothetical protein